MEATAKLNRICQEVGICSVKIGIGDSVCDRYTGSCGRVTDIINDEVELEPTIIKKGPRGEYLETTEPPIKAKIANLKPDHIKRYEEVPSDHELKKAEELKSLVINCMEHEILGSGRVIDSVKARATPCTCFTVEGDGFEACWSPGVLGLMTSQKNPEQIREFCKMGKLPGGEGAGERFLKVRGAISEAHERWEKKGGGLPGWWEEVARSLEERKIEL
ncbi:unnamed protein product [marine sediment metagenome]|uniref:Uncharacterized protein n=1 Tax=marine sediment metagenome TaxID=412755 RepID=X1GS11_9ZZZZ